MSPNSTAPNVAQKFPPPVEAPDGMAVSSQRDASKAGAEILAAGGKRGRCGGGRGLCPGGGASLLRQYRRRRLRHHPSRHGKNTFINFREKAPAAASANMYLDADGNVVPGLPSMATRRSACPAP